MPLSAVRTAFFRFLPTLVRLLHLPHRRRSPWSFATLLALVFLLLLVVFAPGMAPFFATLQVYFRDTTSFLPYVDPDLAVPVARAVVAEDVTAAVRRPFIESSTRCTRCSAA